MPVGNKPPSHQSNIAPIVGGTVAGGIFLAVLAASLLVLRCRRRRAQFEEMTGAAPAPHLLTEDHTYESKVQRHNRELVEQLEIRERQLAESQLQVVGDLQGRDDTEVEEMRREIAELRAQLAPPEYQSEDADDRTLSMNT